jgi:co-chaperonin GroES (HSP10)
MLTPIDCMMLKALIGNSALCVPEAPLGRDSEGGIFLPNVYSQPVIVYKVLMIGPGAWVKRGKKRVFLTPEVKPGDRIITKAMFDHTAVKEHFADDARGACIIDAARIEAVIEETNEPKSTVPVA